MAWEDGLVTFGPSFSGSGKKDIHFWCGLRESTSALFPRSLETLNRTRDTYPLCDSIRSLLASLVRHATWRDRRARSISSKNKGYQRSLQTQKARGGMGTDGKDQRSGEYLTNSGIVNYAMQISERHAASAIQRGVCGSCIQVRSSVVFIIWDVQCFASIVRVSCLGTIERGRNKHSYLYDYLHYRWNSQWFGHNSLDRRIFCSEYFDIIIFWRIINIIWLGGALCPCSFYFCNCCMWQLYTSIQRE